MEIWWSVLSHTVCSLLPDAMESLKVMFKPRVTSLPGHIQSVYVQNITKLYSSILVRAEIEGNQERIREVGQLLLDKLPMFVQSSDLEVQERVSTCVLASFKLQY